MCWNSQYRGFFVFAHVRAEDALCAEVSYGSSIAAKASAMVEKKSVHV